MQYAVGRFHRTIIIGRNREEKLKFRAIQPYRDGVSSFLVHLFSFQQIRILIARIDSLWYDIGRKIVIFTVSPSLNESTMDKDESFFRSLVDSSPVGMYLTDANSNCIYVNKSWCRMAGLEPEEAKGKGWIQGIYPEDLSTVMAQWTRFIEGKGTWDMEYRLHDRRGNILWVHGTADSFYNSHNEFIGYFGRSVDITQRKEAEAALLEYQKKLHTIASELLIAEETQQKKIAGELHDGVCQLLVFCKMSLGKLRDSLEDQAAVRDVKEISATMDRAIEQIRTLMFDLANPILFELGLCRAIEDLADDYLQKKHGITAAVNCENLKCEDPAFRLPDDLKGVIYQAVRELFVNIVKHAKATAVDVNVFFKDDHLRTEVVDDGVGFDYAAEVHNHNVKKKIGLFIITERLRYFQGHLDFKSGPGKGTTAIIEIPLPQRKGSRESY